MLKGQAKKDYQRRYMREYRRNVDGYCYMCGRWGVVDRHHIDRNHDNNGDGNVVTLCPNCHADIHRRGTQLDPVRPNATRPVMDADGYVIYDD